MNNETFAEQNEGSRSQLSKAKCIHCGKTGEHKLTKDHLFPRCWRPKTIYADSHLTLPSCFLCNNTYGKVERQLLQLYGFQFLPETVATEGLSSAVLNAFNVKRARDAKDREHRFWNATSFLRKQVRIKASDLDNYKLVSNFQHDPIDPSRDELVLNYVPYELWRQMARKFLRGIYFLNSGLYPPSAASVFLFTTDFSEQAELLREESQSWPSYSFAPLSTFKYRVGDGLVVLFAEIWGRQKLLAHLTLN